MERAAVAKAQRCESACVHRTARVAVKCEAEAWREEVTQRRKGPGCTGLCQPNAVCALGTGAW